LDIDLYDNQVAMIDAVCDLNKPYIGILASRGSGKTFCAAIGLVKLCLDNPGFRIGIFGPKMETAKRLVKEDIIGRILTPSSKVYTQIDWEHSSNSFIHFKNGSTIKALSASPTATQESEHFHCVLGSTEVKTRLQNKQICDILIGEEVLSFNLDSNQEEFKPVVAISKKPTIKKIYRIRTENGKELTCTEDHRIYTKNRGYIEAKDLTLEDTVITIGALTNIKSIEIVDEKVDYVYDIQVESNNNFFANDILIHNCVVLDECLTEESIITLADGTKKTIGEIVKSKTPVKVLSFDEKQNKLVEADVIDFKKIPLKKQLLEIKLEDGKTIKCTEDHKFYTRNRGWVEAKNLTEKDDLINIKICEGCGITFIPLKNARFCTNKCYVKWFEKNKRKEERICQQCKKPFQAVTRANAKFCSYNCEKTRICLYCQKPYVRIGQEKYCSPECKKTVRVSRIKPRTGCVVCGKLSRDRDTTHCMKHNNWTDTTGVPVITKCIICNNEFTIVENRKLTCSDVCLSKSRSDRMTLNNPTSNPETVEKIKESLKIFFEEHPDKLSERLKNFKNAPVYTRGKMTRPEQAIIAMNIPNLRYTGDGTKWITFSNKKHKNPDFWFDGTAKVVEVGDFQFWHTKEEAAEVVRLYKEKNTECLYLDADNVMKNPIEAEKQIRSFLCI